MKLPHEFAEKMRKLMPDSEYEQFINSFDADRYYGLRANTLKVSPDRLVSLLPFKLEKIPWTKDGFYYDGKQSPGKLPYYHAGLYYIQEPSAMLPAEILQPEPGERILDLCAAPGGKTVQIAAAMQNKGLIVSNDINADRVKALVKNIELCGIKNAIVTNEDPKILASNFRQYFDRILVDAPCSGEGMFRKDEDAARSWAKYKCEKCSALQIEILEQADKMLKPGGYLVYSTCTFSPEEDEQIIMIFLNKHDDYEILPVYINETSIYGFHGIESGRPHWAENFEGLDKTVRIWPHKVKGEGHFAALLRKKGEDEARSTPSCKNSNTVVALKKDVSAEVKIFYEFCRSYFFIDDYDMQKGYFMLNGSNLYWLPVICPDLKGIKVAKFGWYLGSLTKHKFEPSHSFVMALKKEQCKNVIDFAANSNEIEKYLKGETLIVDAEKGYNAVCIEGFPLGLAKVSDGVLKNLYPKGWRKML